VSLLTRDKTRKTALWYAVDGGHYERSVSYHIESLQQYFESLYVMRLLKDSDYTEFVNLIKPAYSYLNCMVDVSGSIPLFNDGATDYPFKNAAEFLSRAECLYTTQGYKIQKGDYFYRWYWKDRELEKNKWYEDGLCEKTGYLHKIIRLTDERYSLFFDVGDGGPDSNLGHAHADALSILLSSRNKNILVDSGVYTYEPGLERNDCRSTKAHNTIEIDNTNSAEIWSAFRVAKRGHTKIDSFHNNGDVFSISATHDGYCKCLKKSVKHRRNVIVSKNIITIKDTVFGKGGHKAVARFHIGANCELKQVSDYECMIDNVRLQSSEFIHVVEHEYAEEFGIKVKSKSIEIPFEFNKDKKISVQMILN